MSYHDPETRLVAWFEIVEPGNAPQDILHDVFAVTRTTRQRRSLLGRLRPAPDGDLRSRRSLAMVGGGALVIVLAVAGLAMLWSQVIQGPPLVGPPVTSPSPVSSPTSDAAGEPGFVMLDAELTHAREWHTATLLADGRVLIAGGRDGGRPLSTAELWDPATESFVPTGDMSSPRTSHTATLLPDGRVLIVGGDGPEGFGRGRSAELWDPATETFAPAGHMALTQHHHTATLLPDGQVLVVGVGTTELWNPVTQSFSPRAVMPIGDLDEILSHERGGGGIGGRHNATLLADGSILFTGGAGTADSIVQWRTDGTIGTGMLVGDREWHTATRLLNGDVLIMGGSALLGPSSDTEVWSPRTLVSVPAGELRHARGIGHTATLLPDGRVLIIGGTSLLEVTTPEAEISDGLGMSFWPAGALISPRTGHTATLLSDGRVLVVGGSVQQWGTWSTLATAELWTPPWLVDGGE